jgi:RNA polymerase sigma-70 factor, ECF subfamily
MILRRDPLANPEPLVRRVYAYVAYRIGPGPDAEDVTSEVFARAVKYRHTYDPARGKPKHWLLGIARRCVDEQLSQREELPLFSADHAAPDDVEEETVARLTLWRAVSRLNERERELVLLYHAGLKGGEIADLLGLRRGSADVALHRALAKLRELLEREEQFGEEPVERTERRAQVRY